MAQFNLPFGVRVSNSDPLDADRYVREDVSARDLLITEERAYIGLQTYVESENSLFILKDLSGNWIELMDASSFSKDPSIDNLYINISFIDTSINDIWQKIDGSLFNLDTSIENIWTKFGYVDISLNNIDTSIENIWTKFGYVDISLNNIDTSIENIWTKFGYVDISLNNSGSSYNNGNLIDISNNIISVDSSYLNIMYGWEAVMGVPTTTWTGISISYDAQYQTAVAEYDYIYISSDYGESWTAKESQERWTSVSINDDGQYQTACELNNGIYVSSDWGENWTLNSSISGPFIAVSISGDGQYQTVLTNSIYISSDFGETWHLPSSDISTLTYKDIAVSYNGNYQIIASFFDHIFVSDDYGESWTAKESIRNWVGVAISEDGEYQTAIADYYIYVSSDYGENWTPKTSVPNNVQAVSMSLDGQYQTVVLSGGSIYISNDYGDNWTDAKNSGAWSAVSLSGDGQYQTATKYNGNIYRSLSYGIASKLFLNTPIFYSEDNIFSDQHVLVDKSYVDKNKISIYDYGFVEDGNINIDLSSNIRSKINIDGSININIINLNGEYSYTQILEIKPSLNISELIWDSSLSINNWVDGSVLTIIDPSVYSYIIWINSYGFNKDDVTIKWAKKGTI